MGVDFATCEVCQGCYPDSGDNYPRSVNIDGESRRVCPSCLSEDMDVTPFHDFEADEFPVIVHLRCSPDQSRAQCDDDGKSSSVAGDQWLLYQNVQGLMDELEVDADKHDGHGQDRLSWVRAFDDDESSDDDERGAVRALLTNQEDDEGDVGDAGDDSANNATVNVSGNDNGNPNDKCDQKPIINKDAKLARLFDAYVKKDSRAACAYHGVDLKSPSVVIKQVRSAFVEWREERCGPPEFYTGGETYKRQRIQKLQNENAANTLVIHRLSNYTNERQLVCKVAHALVLIYRQSAHGFVDVVPIIFRYVLDNANSLYRLGRSTKGHQAKKKKKHSNVNGNQGLDLLTTDFVHQLHKSNKHSRSLELAPPSSSCKSRKRKRQAV